ncbi:TPA: hypothetical protein NJ327_004496 [Vibrio parahaemolyticus]|uniref:hypothetical protein n=1 Tax=Vibrio parahaemolyticus TaxID=670 RepID=UPI00111D3DD7|nr:hypothetical protein [Vibrio parahaemolyticus]TOH03853.1 hypothetical protein CGI90_24430 [Vibrio parahaemolyticus]HCG7131689.1 hypothetical protein [Vibrio parahaemolyticus]
MKLDTQVTGNIGMYYVCYHLSRMGWNVMPTARNAKGIDIVAYNTQGTEFIGVQVKSLSKRNPVPLGTSLDKIMGDYWVIANNVAKEPNVFIMTPEEVKSLAHRGEKDGRISYWLQPKSYDQADYRDAWSRIGLGHQSAST